VRRSSESWRDPEADSETDNCQTEGEHGQPPRVDPSLPKERKDLPWLSDLCHLTLVSLGDTRIQVAPTARDEE
jgi:hypothetical protein